MAEDQYLGEMRMFAGNYAPEGWALCDGRLLSVGEYPALYQLLVNTYGGIPGKTFALPDMRARVVVGAGQGPGRTNRPLGSAGGAASVSIGPANMPAHSHALMANSGNADTSIADSSAMFAQNPPPSRPYNDTTLATGTYATLSPAVIAPNISANQPHDNVMPSQGINFIIALEGLAITA